MYDRAWVTPNPARGGSIRLILLLLLTATPASLAGQLGYMWLSDSGNGPDIGRAVLIGLGYDARVADNASITTFINAAGVHTPDPHAQVGQIGVGLTLH
jgi:hypothetical protein